jgi:hypothetical protein
MDKKAADQRDERIEKLMPPKTSDLSMVLNGAGNGAMLGGLPYIGAELYSKIKKTEMTPKAKLVGEFAVVLGAAIGAIYGTKEARDLKTYRNALRGEIEDLRARVDAAGIAPTATNWVEKEQDRPAPASKPSR